MFFLAAAAALLTHCLAFETPLLDSPPNAGTVMFLFLSLHVVVLFCFFLAFTQINYSNFMQSAGREERDLREGNFKHFRVVVGVASLVSF